PPADGLGGLRRGRPRGRLRRSVLRSGRPGGRTNLVWPGQRPGEAKAEERGFLFPGEGKDGGLPFFGARRGDSLQAIEPPAMTGNAHNSCSQGRGSDFLFSLSASSSLRR